MSCKTNLLKENNELKNKVKNLSNKLERCYNTKITFERMLSNKRSYGDMSGIGVNKSMTKGERKTERKMKSKNKRGYLISCASNAITWDILQMGAQM